MAKKPNPDARQDELPMTENDFDDIDRDPVTAEPVEPRKMRKPDPELAAMGRIGRILDTLDDTCRGRVTAWVYSRFMSNNGKIFPNNGHRDGGE